MNLSSFHSKTLLATNVFILLLFIIIYFTVQWFRPTFTDVQLRSSSVCLHIISYNRHLVVFHGHVKPSCLILVCSLFSDHLHIQFIRLVTAQICCVTVITHRRGLLEWIHHRLLEHFNYNMKRKQINKQITFCRKINILPYTS